jgi:hypothetical protein
LRRKYGEAPEIPLGVELVTERDKSGFANPGGGETIGGRGMKKMKFVKIVVAYASGLCNDALNNSGKDPQKGRAT